VVASSFHPDVPHALMSTTQSRTTQTSVAPLMQSVTADEQELLGLRGQIAAIHKSQAVIEFALDGTIQTANRNFLETLGYELGEIRGKHHRMFVDPSFAASAEYREFWENLAAGKFQSGEYERRGKGGRKVWIQATYNPILDAQGRPCKVVKFATDITAATLRQQAISRTQATIEFRVDGTIVSANANFLAAVGYSLEEIQGRHHSLFVGPEYAESAEYRDFWKDLRAGKPRAGEFRRFAKGGRELWLRAAYNPLYDNQGRVVGVEKNGSDITAEVRGRTEMARVQSMMEGAPFNVIYADRELSIRYLNPASRATLATLEKHMACRASEILGKPIDAFHPSLAGVRQVLGDARSLPYRTALQIGPEQIDLLVSPTFDDQQRFLGPMLTWEVVTKKLEIENSVRDSATALAAAAEELSAITQQMGANAEQTATQAGAVSAASEQVSQSLQTVSASAEEMGASIREISKGSAEAVSVATRAVQMARSTNEQVAKLGISSKEIGKVTKVITSIAQQTNLLALNATIEAARAGEAGRGFSVVAGEVKELAKKTAVATEEISTRIEAIQGDTRLAVDAIAAIAQIIVQINDTQTTIAGAVEEQTATTTEITRNVSGAAQGGTEIAQNIAGVAKAAQETSSGAANAQQAVAELARMAARLNELVSR